MSPSPETESPAGRPHVLDAGSLASLTQTAPTPPALSAGERALIEQYGVRREAFAGRAALLSIWLVRFALLRYLLLAIVVLALAGAAGALWPVEPALPVAVLAVVGWLATTSASERCRLAQRRHDALRRINAESIARIERQWRAIPQSEVELPAERRGLAGDLDLFGFASLFHLICQAQTQRGISLLRDWLLTAALPDELARRQQAVAELAGELELRQEFAARGRVAAGHGRGGEEFAHWAAAGVDAHLVRWIRACKIGSPSALATLVALFAVGYLPAEAFGGAMLLLLAHNLIATVLLTGPIHDLVLSVLAAGGRASQYRGQLQLLGDAQSRRASVAAALGDAGLSASDSNGALARLERLAFFARLFRVPAVWLPLQLVTLWDFHVFGLVEAWRRRHAAEIPQWLEGLGRFEALVSLAALAHDNPGWSFPHVGAEATAVFSAQGLAHPLQRDLDRVGNDVTLGPRGSLLFVTGSNMAGKSTLLRSIGTAVVLGQAGGPVCAARLQMHSIALGTVFRVQDSIERGASLFLTELLRLKQVVDQARLLKDEPGVVPLFLLDEILHGTNTAERHIAARSVILELLGQGACGAVSTHDLDLPLEPKLAQAARNVHFSDRLLGSDGSPRLEFDYKLRDGIAQSTNALRLLEIIGLKPDV